MRASTVGWSMCWRCLTSKMGTGQTHDPCSTASRVVAIFVSPETRRSLLPLSCEAGTARGTARPRKVPNFVLLAGRALTSLTRFRVMRVATHDIAAARGCESLDASSSIIHVMSSWRGASMASDESRSSCVVTLAARQGKVWLIVGCFEWLAAWLAWSTERCTLKLL
jgi:hypothetical protein